MGRIDEMDSRCEIDVRLSRCAGGTRQTHWAMIARDAAMTAKPATENERRTRRARIDPRLRACGWQIVSFDHARDERTAHAH